MKEYLKEWADNIEELSKKEVEYINLKETYETKSDSLLEEVAKLKKETGEDIIKNTYGGNNDKTRRKYVKDQLQGMDKNITDLEISIDYLKRRISFLKGLINYISKEE